ncbi:MAG: DNA primase [Firmicutes bacterium]|nr:DNA primase [Bacillota bacterium]
MAYVDNEELNDIRSKANIVDIISSYGIEVIKKGKDYVCVCPFHNDHSPSMSISVSRQIYKCFACGEGGNVFTFVQNYEKVSFVEAVKIVAEKIDYHLKNDISVQRVDKHKKEHDILNLATMFFQNNLNTSSGIEAKKYLKDRKIDEKIINDFQIGLALDGKDDLFKLLHSKGYSADLLESLGLVTIVNDQVYDFFKGRVVFPILDIEGNVVGFSARIYRGEKDTSKYVNTKETLIFTKGNNLFNYYKARGPSKKEKQIIIVEGQMDAIRVYSSGLENVVALGGTALTQNQINLIKRLNVKVILCLDGDSAGEKATLVNGDLLTKNDINVQVVRLSDYKDPDEYIINKGIDAFKDNISNAIDYIDFKIKAQKKEININNTEELATYINKIIVDVSNIKDPILKEVTLNKISTEYNISLDILKNKLDSLNKEEKIAKEIFVSDKKEVKKLNGIDIAIRKILFYMMNDIKYIKLYQNKIGFFEDKLYRDIANEIVYYSEKNQTINVADFISYIQTNEKLGKVVFEIIDANDSELNELEFINYIKVLNQKSSELRIKKIKEQIKLELDIDKKKKLLEEIAVIKQGSVKND